MCIRHIREYLFADIVFEWLSSGFSLLSAINGCCIVSFLTLFFTDIFSLFHAIAPDNIAPRYFAFLPN